MRNAFLVFSLLPIAVLCGWAQSSTQAAPAAKPPVHHAAAGTPTAVIETAAGKLTCTLFPDKAPIGVENFIGLATGTKDWRNPVSGATKHGVPLYDGTIFHRVIPGFMIQGGDPAGNGTGDPGYKFKNEVSSDLLFDKPGRLAYANSGPDTNGSQFFITEVATPHLNGNYTIFGQCDEASVALVKQIAHMATDPSNDRPFRAVKIVHIKIIGGDKAAPAARSTPPAKKSEDVAALKAVREEWIKNTQQELWREGEEITFQSRGTTLYVKYALAGDAFAFQFGETFLGQNGAKLKALGFKRAYLSNGDTGWTYDLARY
jgi:peptidyl-prolyl cis-trans isomerase A (cyclophilin A)